MMPNALLPGGAPFTSPARLESSWLLIMIFCNYSADTPYFHGTRMTPMERISTDLLSVFCGLAINEKAPFIRIYQSNPCHPCVIFKG
jgi:hypothetical protein